MVSELTQLSEFESVIAKNQLVLVDFYTTWCEPCKVLDQVLDRINSKLPEDGEILKVDSEVFDGLANHYDIRSAPVLILFKNGEVIWRLSGFMMDNELLQTINKVSRETDGTEK